MGLSLEYFMLVFSSSLLRHKRFLQIRKFCRSIYQIMIHMGKFNRWFGTAFDLNFQTPVFSTLFTSLKLTIIKYRELLCRRIYGWKKRINSSINYRERGAQGWQRWRVDKSYHSIIRTFDNNFCSLQKCGQYGRWA